MSKTPKRARNAKRARKDEKKQATQYEHADPEKQVKNAEHAEPYGEAAWPSTY